MNQDEFYLWKKPEIPFETITKPEITRLQLFTRRFVVRCDAVFDRLGNVDLYFPKEMSSKEFRRSIETGNYAPPELEMDYKGLLLKAVEHFESSGVMKFSPPKIYFYKPRPI